MGLIQFDQRWTRQPLEGTSLASPEWRARGMVALFDVRAGIERISGQRSSANTSTREVTPNGVAADFSGTANQQFAHRPEYAQVGPFSLMVLCDIDALSGYGALISKQTNPTTRCPYEFRVGSALTNSRFDVVRADATGATVTTLSASDLISAPSRLVRLVLSVTNSDRTVSGSLWVNGTRVDFSPTANGVQPSDDGSSAVWIGRRSDGATQLDGRIYHIGLFNRAVTASEAQEFTRNPWQLFAPRRIFVPVSAPAASTGGLIQYEQRWKSQPQYGGLDPDHPIAKRFQVAYLPAVSSQNLARGGYGVLNTTRDHIRSPIRAGMATTHSGAGAVLESGKAFDTPRYPLTQVIVCRQSAATNNLIAGITASGGISGSLWYVGGGSSSILSFVGRNNFSATLNIPVTVPVSPDGNQALSNDLVIVAHSASATDHRICVNGSPVATDTTDIGALVAWDRVTMGTVSGGLFMACQLFGYGAPWTNEEMRKLSTSPTEVWKLFTPKKVAVPISSSPSSPGGLIRFSQKWKKQPTGVVKVSPNALLKPVHLFFAPYLRNIMKEEASTITTPTLEMGPGGIGLKASTLGNGMTWVGRPLSGGPCVLFGVVRMVANSSGLQNVWSQRDLNPPYPQINLSLNMGSSGGVVSGKMGVIARDDAISYAQHQISLSDGLHAVAICWNGGNNFLWSVDGETRFNELANEQGTIVNFNSTGESVQIRAAGAASDTAILMSGAHEGAVSQEVLNAFTRDPWKLFEPKSIWVPMTTSSGGTTYFQTAIGSIVSQGALLYNAVFGRLLVGSITNSGSLIKQTRKLFTGSTIGQGSLSATSVLSKLLSGSITLSGALIKQTRKLFSGSATSSGTLKKDTSKSLSGSIAGTGLGSGSTGATQALAGSITASGALAKAITYLRSYSSSLTLVGGLTKRTFRTLSGSITAAGEVTKEMYVKLAGSITALGDLVTFKFTPPAGLSVISTTLRSIRRFIGRR